MERLVADGEAVPAPDGPHDVDLLALVTGETHHGPITPSRTVNVFI